jgi:DNA-binding response OmpR family regulator
MTDPRPLVTILDDSREIRDMLSVALNDAGFETMCFGRATEFEREIRRLSPTACIVDLGLPDKDGLALVNYLAMETHASIIIISGRSLVQEKIVGLELGADDYITKPFEAAEVVARVRAIIRRNAPKASTGSDTTVQFSGWTVHFDKMSLTTPDGNELNLSFAEAQLLRIFLDAPNRLISREQMIDTLGAGTEGNFERAMDVRVSRLRTKLKDDPQNPKIIKTIYGAGYIFIGNPK